MIVLVTRGEEVLLGRSPNWPMNMFSTLAGFIEPGETIEQAVHREIYEEVGITVKNLEYRSRSALAVSSFADDWFLRGI